MTFKTALAAISLAAASLAGVPASAQSVTETFAAHEPDNQQAVNYAFLKQFFDAFTVEDDGRLKIFYSGLEGAGEEFLDAALEGIAQVDPRALNREEQLAYWLNLRNLMVVRGFAGDNPRDIDDERGTPDAPGPLWTAKTATVAGAALSIRDIERDIIAAHFSEPLIVYGLYQGAEGGPSLHRQAFYGGRVIQDLEALGRAFVNEKNQVRARRGAAELPAFYAWYKDDFFGGDDEAVIGHVASLVEKSKTARRLEEAETVDYRDFDYRADAFQPRQARERRDFSNQPTFSGGGGSGSFGS